VLAGQIVYILEPVSQGQRYKHETRSRLTPLLKPLGSTKGSFLPHPPRMTTNSSSVQAVASQQEQAMLVPVTILGPDPATFSPLLTPANAGSETKDHSHEQTSKTSSVTNQSVWDRERENKDRGSKSIRALLARDLPQTRDVIEPNDYTARCKQAEQL